MVNLKTSQVIRLHAKLLDLDGGTPGLRDSNSLESALCTPLLSFEGEEFFPTLIEKLCRISYGIIKNHAFIDGNKRIGIQVLLVLLVLNNLTSLPNSIALEHAALLVAKNELNYEDFLLLVQQLQQLEEAKNITPSSIFVK